MSILYINPNNLVQEEGEFVAKESELKKIITIKKMKKINKNGNCCTFRWKDDNLFFPQLSRHKKGVVWEYYLDQNGDNVIELKKMRIKLWIYHCIIINKKNHNPRNVVL